MILKEGKEKAQDSLGLGFLGVGWIGRNRMQALLKNEKCRAVAISEPSEDNAQEALKLAEKAAFSDSLSEICENADVNAVVIATPSALHARQSIDSLKAGKAVFCQKPLGRTAAEVKEVVNAAGEADRYLGVDLSYRYTKAFRAIYDLIQSGELGKIYAADLVFHNAYGPDKEWFYDISKSGGGCVMDLGIHLIDLALWCLDFPEITSVQSHLYHKGEKLTSFEDKVEDFASVSMSTENDTHIGLDCSWHVSAGKDAVIEARFYGTQGGAAFKNVNGSFYDFTAEKYKGTQTEILVTPPDDWGGRAGVVWAEKLLSGQKHDPQSAGEFIKTAKIIDRIYGR